jgi:hypothetical protein
MAHRVKLRSHHHDVVFEFTKHDLHVYTSCCGASVPHGEAVKLHKRLTKWLARTA